jgi:Aldehyde dehydrogenase family
MRAYTVGDPADPNIMVGPTVSQKQYERVESYIRKRIEEGTEVLVGGEGHPKGLEAGTMAPLCQAAGRWSFPYNLLLGARQRRFNAGHGHRGQCGCVQCDQRIDPVAS